MKRFACLLATVIAFGVSLPANAETRIGVVSNEKMSYFLREETQRRLADEFAGRFAKLESDKRGIPAEQKSFEISYRQKGRSPSSEEQQKFDSKIQQMEREYSAKMKKLGEDYRKRESEEVQKLKASVMQAISTIGKQEKFSSIFIDGEVAYAEPNCNISDITDNVTRALSSAQ